MLIVTSTELLLYQCFLFFHDFHSYSFPERIQNLVKDLGWNVLWKSLLVINYSRKTLWQGSEYFWIHLCLGTYRMQWEDLFTRVIWQNFHTSFISVDWRQNWTRMLYQLGGLKKGYTIIALYYLKWIFPHLFL